MLGPSLLVAPLFHPSTITFYLPSGVWTPLFPLSSSSSSTTTISPSSLSPSKPSPFDKITGPKWITLRSVPMDHVPIYVRENTVLALGPEGVGKPDWEYCGPEVALEFRGYELEEDGEGVEVMIPKGKGAEVGARVVVRRKKGGEGEKGLDVVVQEGELKGKWTAGCW